MRHKEFWRAVSMNLRPCTYHLFYVAEISSVLLLSEGHRIFQEVATSLPREARLGLQIILRDLLDLRN